MLQVSYYFLTACKQKKRSLANARLPLLGYPDSNQERQDQNLQCYHYTIAQSFTAAKVRQVAESAKQIADFFQNNFIFTPFIILRERLGELHTFIYTKNGVQHVALRSQTHQASYALRI